MKEYDVFNDSADLVNVLKETSPKNSEDSGLNKIKHSDEVSEIYLFFDCDFKKQDIKNKQSLEDQYVAIKEMIAYFSDETRGKLYINYPMIESFRYFKKELPDYDYKDYVVDVLIGRKFKELAANDSIFKNFKNICFDLDGKGNLKVPEPEIANTVLNNWKHINGLNIRKANYICTGSFCLPKEKETICQDRILDNQIGKYIKPDEKLAIINSFPLFLYEYIDLDKNKKFFL